MIHPGLTVEKWNSYFPETQLGNIGAEVLRMINWQKQGEDNSARLSLERALELIDLTVGDPKWQGRSKELLRMREILCARIYAPEEFFVSGEQLENYFNPFAVIARR